MQSVFDQVGSLWLVIDSSGEVQRRIDYDTFGYVISDTNQTLDVPFGFAGGLYDPETRFCRFGYRDYDTETGRWTAKDPIFFAGGDTNLYGYCVGDPVNWVDEDGLKKINWFKTSDSRHDKFEKLPDPGKGIVLKGTHGNRDFIIGPNGNQITPSQLPRVLENDVNPGDTIWIAACNTGSGNNSFAEQASKYMPDNVFFAPDNYIFYYDDGKWPFVGPYGDKSDSKGNRYPDYRHPGKFRRFPR